MSASATAPARPPQIVVRGYPGTSQAPERFVMKASGALLAEAALGTLGLRYPG